MGTTLTERQQGLALQLHERGIQTPSIADQIGASKYQVRSFLRQSGRTPSNKLRVPAGEILRRYEEGATAEQIAADLGVSGQTVLRRLRESGAAIRKPGDWVRRPRPSLQRVPDAVIVGLADGTRSCREIADACGLTDEVVRRRMVRLGLPRLEAKARIDRNAFWNGGRTVDKDGYVLLKSPDHPHRTKAGYVREHRLVMETVLGRFLEPGEVVDHIDGDPQNNSPENLRVFASNGEHLAATLEGRPKGSRNPRSTRRGDASRLA